MNTTCTSIKMRNILLGNKINKTKLISHFDLHWNVRPNWIKTMWLKWFKQTTRWSVWNIGLGTSQLQHLMLSQIIYIELNLAPDFDTSGGCHLFFNDYQPWANLCYPFRWLSEGSTFVSHSLHAKILWLRETARASWRSPCCCTCWCFGDNLRGRRLHRCRWCEWPLQSAVFSAKL